MGIVWAGGGHAAGDSDLVTRRARTIGTDGGDMVGSEGSGTKDRLTVYEESKMGGDRRWSGARGSGLNSVRMRGP